MKIITNKVKCKKCGDIIESRIDAYGPPIYCKCKTILIMGGLRSLDRGGDLKSIEDLSMVEINNGERLLFVEVLRRDKERRANIKGYLLRCIKCHKEFESRTSCKAICTHCKYEHRCSESDIIKLVLK